MTGQQSFTVHLTDEVSVDADPLHADAVEFYDSGVWVSHADGRDFFPYERVLRIREGVAADGDDSAAVADDSGPATGERRDAASGTAGAVDDTTLDVE